MTERPAETSVDGAAEASPRRGRPQPRKSREDAPVHIWVAPHLLTPTQAAAIPGVDKTDDEGSSTVVSTREPSQVLTLGETFRSHLGSPSSTGGRRRSFSSNLMRRV